MIREQNPLTVCYTNDVVKNFSANGLLSLGASPAMSEAPEEASEFTQVAGGLLINIGTITQARGKDMLAIAQEANKNECPVVFDPVAVGASRYRKAFCKQFLSIVKPTVIKGNASEILALIDANTTMKGTDSDADLDAVTIAQQAYDKFKTAIVVTGKEDVIAQSNQVWKLKNGSPLLAKVTGAGCLLGAVLASFLQRSLEPEMTVLAEAVTAFNIAAEQAEQLSDNQGPGTFQVKFIDQLSKITIEDIEANQKIEEVS